MLLDRFTIFAQVVNFLVLVLLLRRFLYKPILRAMEDRQAKITQQVEEAEKIKQEASHEKETYQEKHRKLEHEREHLLAQTRQQADSELHQMLHEARAEVDETRARWLQSVEQEKEAFLRELRGRSTHQIYEAARRALADLASAELEAQIIRVFLQRLNQLDAESWQTLEAELQKAGQEIVVYSSFAVPEKSRREIQQTLHQYLPNPGGARFETDPDLLCGIELRAGGYLLAWSLGDYLASIERELLPAFLVEEDARG